MAHVDGFPAGAARRTAVEFGPTVLDRVANSDARIPGGAGRAVPDLLIDTSGFALRQGGGLS
jgi:hypothetical protein